MRRRFGRIVLTMAALALVLAGCGNNEPAQTQPTQGGATTAAQTTTTFAADSYMAELQKKGKIIVGTKYDQPLFGQVNTATGKPEGFDVEMAKILAQKIFGPGGESKIEFTEAISRNREPFLEEGKVDIVIATYTINDARKQKIDFSRPYYVAGQDIMVKKANTTIKAVEDLNGKKVCTAKGSTSETNLRAKAPQSEPILFDTYSECAQALADGRVEAVSTDNVILIGLIDKNPDFKLVGKTFTTEPYGIGMAKNRKGFQAFIDGVLEQSFADGTWKKAYENTVGKVAGPAPQPPPKA